MPIHPMIVHLPMALSIVLPIIAAGLLLAWWRRWLPRRAWWVVVALQGALVIGGMASLKSGEIDEERVERVVPESAIESHEEQAKRFVAVAFGVLLITGLAAVMPNEKVGLSLAALALAAMLAATLLALGVGKAGGELVYRHGAASAFNLEGAGPSATVGESQSETHRRDHDD